MKIKMPFKINAPGSSRVTRHFFGGGIEAAMVMAVMLGIISPNGIAHADDLKLTGSISIDAEQVSDAAAVPQSNAAQIFTVWSHGKQARIDSPGVSTLLDSNSGTVYILNPAANTYYKEPLKNWNPAPLAQMASAYPSQASGNGSPRVQLNFTQTDNTPGNAQTIGGHPTRKYLIDSTVRSQRADTYGGHRDGGMGGGGGWGGRGGGGFLTSFNYDPRNSASLLHTAQFGGGGYGRGRGGNRGNFRTSGRSVHVTGDVWLSDGNGFALDSKDNPLWAQALVAAWSVGPGTNALASKLESASRIPWQTDLTTTWSQYSDGLINDNGTAQASNGDSVTTIATLTSISNVNLPESLFQVPANFTQVSPPSQ